MQYQLSVVFEEGGLLEQAESRLAVAVELGELEGIEGAELFPQVRFCVLGAAGRLDGELGQVFVVLPSAVLEAVEQRALEAGPASGRVVEVV